MARKAGSGPPKPAAELLKDAVWHQPIPIAGTKIMGPSTISCLVFVRQYHHQRMVSQKVLIPDPGSCRTWNHMSSSMDHIRSYMMVGMDFEGWLIPSRGMVKVRLIVRPWQKPSASAILAWSRSLWFFFMDAADDFSATKGAVGTPLETVVIPNTLPVFRKSHFSHNLLRWQHCEKPHVRMPHFIQLESAWISSANQFSKGSP